MILIVGGGLAGLSAAYELEKWGIEYLLIEKERTVGGLCRSVKEKGYTFDYSGHLLCIKDERLVEWIENLLDGKLNSFQRKASIYLKGSWVPYPFQGNLGFLHQEVMEECFADFLEKAAEDDRDSPFLEEDLGSWLIAMFGEGICKYFFAPYNEKLFGVPLKSLVPAGLEWSIPRPSVEQVVNGVFGAVNQGLGYNAIFHYPSRGGIEEIPKAIARKLKSVRCSCELKKFKWDERKAILGNGETVHYEEAISTVPLPELLGLLDPNPAWAGNRAGELRWVSVWVLNVGVARNEVLDQHWVYFPEDGFPFFRVGSYSSFGPHLVPPGKSSLYIEIPGHTVRKLGEENCLREALSALVRCGILRSQGEVEVVSPIFIPVAYVIHNRERLLLLPRILEQLEGLGIHCAGRYGLWGYGTMEDAISQGRALALRLMK